MTTLALLALLAAPARAQLPYTPVFSEGWRSMGLHLGIAQPTGTSGLDAVSGRGPSVGAEFYSYWSDWLAWGLGLDMHQLGTASDPGPPALKGKASFKSFNLLARVNFIRGESWTPYAAGGVGYGLAEAQTTATAAPGSVVCADVNKPCASTASVTLSGAGPVVSAAAGLEAFLTQGLSVSVEGRWQEYRLPLASANFNAPSRRAEALSARLGFHLWFGTSS
ncbi:MAG: outer membrane beta-barrel protein [Elusimicrobia bacterium]|nr:outer membrane beta-barrel protein [Elusimicrobiota bacterium]